MKNKIKSIVLVSMQFLLLGAMVWYCGFIGNIANIILISSSGLLAIWAILTMKLRVNVFPTLLKDHKLYTGGPYRIIRHPMYSSLLILGAGLLINRLDWISASMWILLLIDLMVKLSFEESILKKHFPEYERYMKKSYRLVPFIY